MNIKPPFIIAEIGQAHDGSLGMVHAYIDAVAKTGVDAIKFQTHIAAAESSMHEPFRVKFSTQDKTRFDYWKRMEFSTEQWKEIGNHCKEVGLTFISSPFSNEAVDVLEEAGVEYYKIGSGEVNNFLLLKKIVSTQKPIILSSGMSSFKELDEAVAFLKKHDAEFSILQCTTQYPTQPENYGFNVIQELKERYGVTVGFSDHSGKVATGLAAVSLGAEIVEVHVVFSKQQFGPDVSSSLTLEELKQLKEGASDIYKALQHPVDNTDTTKFRDVKAIFEKSLAVNKDLSKNHVLRFEDLEAKKPKGYGLDASKFESVIGKKLSQNMKQWDFLTEDTIEIP
ncbi:N-acetylneuraminate synthase family protein [Luteirhabdus pelagi]|uniref:N-acetylneuraminate synthase family protein n=1 Tax=Luteirhabdus pelagi TaxID=2792783 RepID=UPI00193A0088|nr:N-acetylneuraminate synthase family protein [Luteirhabdus pelagi]